MRDIKRIRKFCNQLADLWECYPDLRFGQLVTNVFNSGELDSTDPFYIEDEELGEVLFEIWYLIPRKSEKLYITEVGYDFTCVGSYF